VANLGMVISNAKKQLIKALNSGPDPMEMFLIVLNAKPEFKKTKAAIIWNACSAITVFAGYVKGNTKKITSNGIIYLGVRHLEYQRLVCAKLCYSHLVSFSSCHS
jgi:hypothetical protein